MLMVLLLAITYYSMSDYYYFRVISAVRFSLLNLLHLVAYPLVLCDCLSACLYSLQYPDLEHPSYRSHCLVFAVFFVLVLVTLPALRSGSCRPYYYLFHYRYLACECYCYPHCCLCFYFCITHTPVFWWTQPFDYIFAFP